jgi:hypothetical protein
MQPEKRKNVRPVRMADRSHAIKTNRLSQGACMNSADKPTPFLPSASEYILDNFEQTERIAMLVLNRN